jgi:putative ABC transport system substrate-binding protein
MRRRDFIAGLGGAAAWPVAAQAQPLAVPVIGFLHSSSSARPANLTGFLQGLAEAGYVDGRNVAIEFRWADDHPERLPGLAADLVRRRVAVIVTMNATPVALAAKAATQTIPIVFQLGSDPVEFGLVASLNRPGGNVTGVTALAVEVAPKRLQMLLEVVPAANPIAFLVNPANLANEARELTNAAGLLGVRLLLLNATRVSDFEAVFRRLVEERAGALLIAADPLFFTFKDEIIALATRHAIPTSHYYREAVFSGGLKSYAPNPAELSRIVGGYTGRSASPVGTLDGHTRPRIRATSPPNGLRGGRGPGCALRR